MTEYFEVIEQDGPARIGELRFPSPITTPTLADDIITNNQSQWPAESEPEQGADSKLTVLPYRAFPSGTDERVIDGFNQTYPDVEFPSAAVITPHTATSHGTDAYILSTAQGIVGHASAFTDAIITTRDAIPPDTALYLSGVATPRNVSILLYAGVDLIDTLRARIAGTQGYYLTSDAKYPLDALSELPCSCLACTKSLDEFTRDDCVTHNTLALKSAVATARERIRKGTFRDYIEGQARHDQWCTATFRELDQQWGYLEQRTPILRRSEITAASDDTLHRVEIKRFANRVTSRYHNRFDGPLVLVPCSARKPYSRSQSHKQFHDAIQWRGHLVSMTSPIGVVPQELELTYPAQHYDSVVTNAWSGEEIKFVSEVLERYLSENSYPFIVAHLPDHGYRDIVQRTTGPLDIPVEFTVEDHPTADVSLANLSAALSRVDSYSKETRVTNTIRAIADFQFGDNAGETLFADAVVTDRYPKHRVFSNDDDQLATLVPEYGVLALTLNGARRLVDRDVRTPRVEIEEFVPHGSVLAPGVTAASDQIRTGDEVVIVGDRAFGVGRAVMAGPDMVRSSRGVAVEVRHVDERRTSS